MVDDASLPRAVVDTNVLIRGILSSTGASSLVADAIFRRQCLLLTSRTHLNELHRVLSRPLFVKRYGITRNQRHRLVARLYALSIFVQPSGQLAVCRDPKDDYLIEMALLGQATHLVSEDNDFHDDADVIELLRHYGTHLVRAGAFAQILIR